MDESTTKEQIIRNPQFGYKVLRHARTHPMPPRARRRRRPVNHSRWNDGQNRRPHSAKFEKSHIATPGKPAVEYRGIISSKADGGSTPDPKRFRITALSDDQEFYSEDFPWNKAEYFKYERTLEREADEHE